MSLSKKVRAGLVPALLMLLASTAHAGVEHSLNLPQGMELPDRLMKAVKAQHDHDFVTARRDLAAYLDDHPGDAQALLVRAAIESATGHWRAAREACAPLITQMPAWVVAACIGQSAEGLDSVRRNLTLIEQRPTDADPQLASWADSIANDLKHRLSHRQATPVAPHPEH